MLVILDATDHAILAALQVDGRRTNAALAEEVHLSPSACLRRIRRLEDEGIIAGYVALLDRGKVDRGTTVFVEISLDSQQEELLDRFEAAVRLVPEVMSCYLMAGNSDYLLKVAVADVADYERIHRTYMARLPGVAQLRSSFALRTVTESTAVGFASGR